MFKVMSFMFYTQFHPLNPLLKGLKVLLFRYWRDFCRYSLFRAFDVRLSAETLFEVVEKPKIWKSNIRRVRQVVDYSLILAVNVWNCAWISMRPSVVMVKLDVLAPVDGLRSFKDPTSDFKKSFVYLTLSMVLPLSKYVWWTTRLDF